MNKSMFTSNKDDWETPDVLFNELNNKYHFTIDVASSEQNHKLPRYYTKEQDGLKQDWSGEIVFCNPPYGREISKWIKKAYYSNTKCVLLIPARTDTKYFHDYIYKKWNVKVEFLKGRLKFSNSKNSAPFPSMIVIFN